MKGTLAIPDLACVVNGHIIVNERYTCVVGVPHCNRCKMPLFFKFVRGAGSIIPTWYTHKKKYRIIM